MPTMIQTLFGELPVIGTLKRCVATEKGWRGEDEERGRIFDVVYDPSEPGVIARMPENSRLTMREKDGRPIGVYLVSHLCPRPACARRGDGISVILKLIAVSANIANLRPSWGETRNGVPFWAHSTAVAMRRS